MIELWLTVRYKTDNKPYATFSSAGSTGEKALDSVDRVCHSLRLKKAFEGVIAIGKPSPEMFEECQELGRKMAEL